MLRFFERPDRDVVPLSSFRRFGALSHQQRLIALDTIVSAYINAPAYERFDDDSVRVETCGQHVALTKAIDARYGLRSHVRHDPFRDKTWLYLFSPLCTHCLAPWPQHIGDQRKCLFGPTRWEEIYPPDVQTIRWGLGQR